MTPSDRIEASAIGAVRAGELQLGLIPSHAFEAQGVTTFRALQAPFADRLLGARSSCHDGSARRPAPGRPSRDRADRARARTRGHAPAFRIPEAARLAGGLRRADDPRRLLAGHPRRSGCARRPPGRPRRRRQRHLGLQRLRQRRVVPSERRRRLPAGRLHRRQHRAAFRRSTWSSPRPQAFGRLRPEQRAVLRRAAVEARAASIPAADERAAAAAFCRAGGTIVAATQTRCVRSERRSHRCSRRCAATRRRARRSRASSGSGQR